MNFKFEMGDIVKIDQNWLDPGENPDTKYIVRDEWDGKVEVYLPKENDIKAFKGIWTWANYMMYKVGHVNIAPDGVEYYEVGDVLANDKTTVIVVKYKPETRMYTIEGTGNSAGLTHEKSRPDLIHDGYMKV